MEEVNEILIMTIINPENFTISEDEMDVDAINKTPTSNNLNVVVAEEGVAVSSSTKKSKGKKAAKEPAPALPFRIYHKNKGRSKRIAKMQANKFKIDEHGYGLLADKALSLSESE
ncbi:hypothetical protein Tco_0046767 [Tanacetum coccineum]